MARPRRLLCKCGGPLLEGFLKCAACQRAYNAELYRRSYDKKIAANARYLEKPGVLEIRRVQHRIRTLADKPSSPENMARYNELVEQLHALKARYGIKQITTSV